MKLPCPHAVVACTLGLWSATASADGRALDGPGQLREITIRGPAAVEGPKTEALAAARVPTAPLAPTAPASASVGGDDVSAELAVRQMRRFRPKLDACVAAAQRRAPERSGTVVLALEVADRRVTRVTVRDDAVHDAQLNRCLVDAAGRFGFALAAAKFSYPITVAPAVAAAPASTR